MCLSTPNLVLLLHLTLTPPFQQVANILGLNATAASEEIRVRFLTSSTYPVMEISGFFLWSAQILSSFFWHSDNLSGTTHPHPQSFWLSICPPRSILYLSKNSKNYILWFIYKHLLSSYYVSVVLSFKLLLVHLIIHYIHTHKTAFMARYYYSIV